MLSSENTSQLSVHKSNEETIRGGFNRTNSVMRTLDKHSWGGGRLFEKPHRRGDAMQKNEQEVAPFSEKLDFQ